MPDLLLELFSEEIPAGMQKRGAQDLQRLVTDGLKDAGLDFEAARNFAGPRRLTLAVEGLPDRSPDISEERKGPRVGSPEKAIEGFLRGAGLGSIDEAEIVADEKKGDFYVARISKPGRATADVLAELIPSVIRQFPWPKSQRWGSGRLRWVRPLHSILCLLDGSVVPFEVDGIASGDTTYGHRFMAPKAIQIRDFEGYAKGLREAFVVLDAQERAAIILEDARKAAAAEGLELVEDAGLLSEAAGLVEWPVVLMGRFDDAFLALPPEVIVTAIKKHQKCFSLREPSSPSPLMGEGKGGGEAAGSGSGALPPTPNPSPPGGGASLASRFILVSNLVAQDGGKAIIAGNERVVRARLSDAKFFWDQDRSRRLDDLLPELGGIIFHEKLGTQAERVERLKALAKELAPVAGADPAKAERAAELCKADLVTGMVGEFPDLQGLMGEYYALDQGEDPSVAAAIKAHYKPAGQNDTVPTDPVSIAVALADKLDTLVGFWAIGETPTGSKDPYALRRAALGVIRIVLENGLRLQLQALLLVHSSKLLHSFNAAFSTSGWLEVQERSWERDEFVAMCHRYIDAIECTPWQCVFDTSEIKLDLEKVANADAWLSEGNRDVYERVQKCLVEKLSIIASFNYDADDIEFDDDQERQEIEESHRATANEICEAISPNLADLLAFFHDRLKVYLRDRGARHDLIDAVLSVGGSQTSPPTPTLPHKGGGSAGGDSAVFQDDLLMIVARVEALGKFLDTDDGANLLAGVKRAANILRIEEKKDKHGFGGAPDTALFAQDEERALARAIDEASRAASAAIAKEDFAGAMSAIAQLRAPVDSFFDHVTVNADDPKLRENRLKLLNRIRESTLAVADFSKISG